MAEKISEMNQKPQKLIFNESWLFVFIEKINKDKQR